MWLYGAQCGLIYPASQKKQQTKGQYQTGDLNTQHIRKSEQPFVNKRGINRAVTCPEKEFPRWKHHVGCTVLILPNYLQSEWRCRHPAYREEESCIEFCVNPVRESTQSISSIRKCSMYIHIKACTVGSKYM